MTHQPVNGIVPVVLTPFKDDNQIDWPGYRALIDWYLAHGVDALFAVCQSSEMFFLSLDERVELASKTVEQVKGQIPVVASGHVSIDYDEAIAELLAISATGIDGLVLVTNRLGASAEANDHDVIKMLERLLADLPMDMPLGLYECPYPYRLLLSDNVLRFCAQSGRFTMLKDVSCDLPTVVRRLELVRGSPLTILNAHGAIAWPAIQAGATGFCGVFNSYHPDLYSWLLQHGSQHTELANELAVFLALSASTEAQGHPASSKLFHQRLGTFDSIHCRCMDVDLVQTYWGIEQILDYIDSGTQHFRRKIAGL